MGFNGLYWVLYTFISFCYLLVVCLMGGVLQVGGGVASGCQALGNYCRQSLSESFLWEHLGSWRLGEDAGRHRHNPWSCVAVVRTLWCGVSPNARNSFVKII